MHSVSLQRKAAWLLFIAIVGLLGCTVRNSITQSDSARIVARIVDGDTLAMENGERIRLIGVNTPETKHPKKPVEHFGQEAAAYTKRIVEGKGVRLEFDPANAHRGHRDRTPQRRTLAYVFLENGVMLKAEIIRQGYGFADTQFPFSRMEEFRRLQREARERRKGLWAIQLPPL